MIKLVPVQTNAIEASSVESVGASTGPSLVSRTTSYRGARRTAPVKRMLSLLATTPAPAEEAEVELQGETLPIIFA